MQSSLTVWDLSIEVWVTLKITTNIYMEKFVPFSVFHNLKKKNQTNKGENKK